MSEPISEADLFFRSDESVVSGYEPSLADSFHQLQDSTGMSAAETKSLLTETSQFFYGAGINSEFASKLHGQIVQHIQRPPDNPTFNQWQTESRQHLREKYPDDADERMEKVKAYVNSHPTIRKQLEDSGMGSHPDVILALAERANNLRPRRK